MLADLHPDDVVDTLVTKKLDHRFTGRQYTALQVCPVVGKGQCVDRLDGVLG